MQRLYDHIVKHLITQWAKSQGDGSCLYRDNYGHSCAVGCLIKDEFYSKELEEKVVRHDAILEVLEKSFGRALTEEEILLLEAMQRVHDDLPVECWVDGCRLVATCFKLVPYYMYDHLTYITLVQSLTAERDMFKRLFEAESEHTKALEADREALRNARDALSNQLHHDPKYKLAADAEAGFADEYKTKLKALSIHLENLAVYINPGKK